MEVTKLVVNGREKPKVNGNWLAYRKQLTKRINNLRKKLGVATKPRAKCAGRVEVTKDDIAQDLKFGHLLLLTSERAWANAMSMREVHLGERRSITSSTRSHIISKLQKSTIYARNLLKVLQSDNICDANVNDVLEVRAYAATLSGALEFERHKWEMSLKYYAESRIIYSTLAAATKNDIYQELLSDPVDPSIRYCTYQMQISRLLSINLIAQRYFPSSDAWLIAVIERLDSGALNNELAKSRSEDDIVPSTITWRSRTINIENSVIILALVSVQMAENKLSESLSVIPSTRTRERASAYDDILTALQDAVYATKHTIDQLSQEGISDDDQRIQDLQVIQTAINYDMISWRIDRNRILLGEGDGIYLENKNYQLAKDDTQRKGKISIQKRLVRLQEKVVLYDSILQSLNSIKDLAGIAADTSLLKDINSKYDYFSSLRCLSIARSHSLLFQNRNALALFFQASSRCNSAHAYISSIMDIEDPSMKISVSNSAVERLKALLNFETQRHRALVEFSNLIDTEQNCEDVDKIPLIERLSEFPSKGVDLSNLVVYPPVLEPSPVKPLFFDAAWNYIKYPGNEIYETDKITDQVKDSARDSDKGIVSKKRWFSLGL